MASGTLRARLSRGYGVGLTCGCCRHAVGGITQMQSVEGALTDDIARHTAWTIGGSATARSDTLACTERAIGMRDTR